MRLNNDTHVYQLRYDKSPNILFESYNFALVIYCLLEQFFRYPLSRGMIIVEYENANSEKNKKQLEKADYHTMAFDDYLYIVDWLGFYYKKSYSSLDANISSCLYCSVNCYLVKK